MAVSSIELQQQGSDLQSLTPRVGHNDQVPAITSPAARMRSRAPSQPLDSAQVIEAATSACRRYGPAKTNVVDVAQFLGRSPASIYKIFGSKAELWDAVADTYFRSRLRQGRFTGGEHRASECLLSFSLEQHDLLLQASYHDRNMFGLAVMAAEEEWASYRKHRAFLHSTVESLLEQGMAAEQFAVGPVRPAAACFCTSLNALWDPRVVQLLPSQTCHASAEELVAFAISGLARQAKDF